MTKNVVDYFDKIIMPMIHKRHPELLPDLSIMIYGSVGLGNDDELSDLEVQLFLDDPLWKTSGWQLQLSLNDCLHKTNPWKQKGSILGVYPQSWLLDFNGKQFLSRENNLPWEKVSFESLFTYQENLIYYDPSGTLNRLRTATAPSRRPEHHWKKSLIAELIELMNIIELKSCVMRNQSAESAILLGVLTASLLHMKFLILHQYYPYRKHLQWAFDRLPKLIPDLGTRIDTILNSMDWGMKVECIEAVIQSYLDYMVENSVLPEIDLRNPDLLDELTWADRLKAYKTPHWKDQLNVWKNKAVKNGYRPDDFWIWQLWRLDNEPATLHNLYNKCEK